MLETIVQVANNKTLNIQVNKNKKNQNVPNDIISASYINGVKNNNRNMSIAAKCKNLA